MEVGRKNDHNKPEADLLLDFGLALWAVAEVSTFGGKKYERHNWLLVEDGESRYKAAMIRHLLLLGTEADDQESELSHLAHVAWNALAALELLARKHGQKSPLTKDYRAESSVHLLSEAELSKAPWER